MLSFKPHSRQDIPLRIKWLNNIEATILAIDNPEDKTNLKKQTKWFDNYENNSEKKFFTIFNDEKALGFMGLSNIKDLSASVFILIGEDEFRGRGIGKVALKYLIDYAWSVLNLNSLNLAVKKENIRAIRLYQSLNFRFFKEDEEFLDMILEKTNFENLKDD